MENSNKYYTPDITELHIGYECEYQDMRVQKTPWKHVTIDSDLHGIACSAHEHGTPEWEDDMKNTFRTKYLDKEDIESEGWKFEEIVKGTFGIQKFSILNTQIKGADFWTWYTLHYDAGYKIPRIKIYEEPRGGMVYTESTTCIYRGICKSINELRTIQRLIGIK